MVIFDRNYEINAGVRECLEDLRVCVIYFNFVNKCGLQELSYGFRCWEVVSERAVVYSNGGYGGEGVEEQWEEVEKGHGDLSELG